MNRQERKIKLLILGESSVGKTALLHCFDGQNFTPTSASTAMDCAMKIIKIQNKPVKLQVWDTVGQEKYRSIAFNLYKDSQGILLAFDLTNPKSFHTLENWMKLINENIKAGFQLLLVGTKSDLINEQAVTKQQINDLLARYDHRFEYFETSSVTKQNVEESFLHLGRKVFEANKEEYLIDLDGDDVNQNNKSQRSMILQNFEKDPKKEKKCCD